MPRTFKLIFGERRIRVTRIEVEVTAEDETDASSQVEALYRDGKLDTRLEEADAETIACETELGHYIGDKYHSLY